jgi:hypothetical protein
MVTWGIKAHVGGAVLRRVQMRTLMYVIAAAIAIVASSTSFNTAAKAEDFVYQGHKHCWYDNGWKGPGWYWCGYADKKGKGWGGAEGFQGWHH